MDICDIRAIKAIQIASKIMLFFIVYPISANTAMIYCMTDTKIVMPISTVIDIKLPIIRMRMRATAYFDPYIAVVFTNYI
jgi:hypothetical protein